MPALVAIGSLEIIREKKLFFGGNGRLRKRGLLGRIQCAGTNHEARANQEDWKDLDGGGTIHGFIYDTRIVQRPNGIVSQSMRNPHPSLMTTTFKSAQHMPIQLQK